MAQRKLVRIIAVIGYVAAIIAANIYISMSSLAASSDATLEVVEASVPASDAGRFDLKIDGTKLATNIGDSSSTGSQVATGGTSHVVLEQANNSSAPTTLSNYTTSVICRDQHGLGTILGSSNPTGASSRQLTFTPPIGSDVVCTFTNTRQVGTFTIINQVVNDNGGSADDNDFGLSLGSNTVTSSQATTIPTGTYALNETGLPGYDVTSITGTGCPSQPGGSVIIAKGQAVTCTITHDDRPGKIRTLLNVINDNGGTLDMTNLAPEVNGQQQALNQYAIKSAGAYTITGPSAAGYSLTTSCVDDALQQTVARPVQLALSELVTCSLTYDDIAPVLTVSASITNDNGGLLQLTDVPLYVDGINVMSNTRNPFDAGLHVASATPVSAYTRATWSGSCAPDGSVTLELAQLYSCSVAYDDIPATATITARVINDDGGTLTTNDFTAILDGSTRGWGMFPLLPGSHHMGVNGVTGYTSSLWGGDCSSNGQFMVSLGQNAICNVTFDDIATTLTASVTVDNQFGGMLTAEASLLSINGGTIKGNETTPFASGTYQLKAAKQSGYSITFGGDCAADGHITIIVAANNVCSITYHDTAARITVQHVLINDNGGTKSHTDFAFSSNGLAAQAFGTDGINAANVSADTYNISEVPVAGYAATYDNCQSVLVAVGQNATCTITDNDIPAALTIFNQVDPAVDQTFSFTSVELGDFSLSGDDTTSGVRIFPNLNSGVYDIAEILPEGWELNTVTCDSANYAVEGDSLAVTLYSGDSATCSFAHSPVSSASSEQDGGNVGHPLAAAHYPNNVRCSDCLLANNNVKLAQPHVALAGNVAAAVSPRRQISSYKSQPIIMQLTVATALLLGVALIFRQHQSSKQPQE